VPGWDSAPETHNKISNVNFDLGGWTLFISPVKFPTTKFLLGFGFFILLKCMVGIPHPKPTAGYQISTSILVGWALKISPVKFPKAKFLPTCV